MLVVKKLQLINLFHRFATMKILDIKIIPDMPVISYNSGGRRIKITSVELKVQRWFFWFDFIEAHPTDHGPIDWANNIRHVTFANKHGKEFDFDVSEEINNFLNTQSLLNTF